jgi:small subunit ribosomal protein S6
MNYESTFIVSPELSTEKIENITTKAKEIIETSKGIIETIQQFGKKKLAYSVNKFREGNYIYIEFRGNTITVTSLENFFKFNDFVMRFLIIKNEKKEKNTEQFVSTTKS